jgi:DNA repair exonuclease SbcCD ATPase subunit
MYAVLLDATTSFLQQSHDASLAYGSLVAVALLVLGLIAAFVKLRPERQQLIAQASQHAVEALAEVLDALERKLADAHDEVERLKLRESELLDRIRRLEQRAQEEVAELRRELARTQADLYEARRAHQELEERCAGCKLCQQR